MKDRGKIRHRRVMKTRGEMRDQKERIKKRCEIKKR